MKTTRVEPWRLKARELARTHAARPEASGKVGRVFAKPQSGTGAGELFIYQGIGNDMMFGPGLTADDVRDALNVLRNAKSLNVYINSDGGVVSEAKAIHAQLRRFPAPKTAFIDGVCASAATLIALACDQVVTSEMGTWMIHNPWCITGGEADDLRKTADQLDAARDDLAAMYAKKTGRTVSAMKALMAVETWMNADQALELGFTDEIAGREAAEPAPEPAPAVARVGSCLAAVKGSAASAGLTEPLPGMRTRAAGQKRAHGYGRIELRDTIGYPRGVSATMVAAQLDACREAGSRAVVLEVDSPGGNVGEAFAMIRAIWQFQKTTGPVIAFVPRFAGSAAAVVVAACEHIIAAPAAEFFFHHASGGDEVTRSRVDRLICDVLALGSNQTAGRLRGLLDYEETLTGEQMAKWALIDQVGGSYQVNETARALALGRNVATDTDRQTLRALNT